MSGQPFVSQTFGNWTNQQSSSGRPYYYNKVTEVSQWDPPAEWPEEWRVKDKSRRSGGTTTPNSSNIPSQPQKQPINPVPPVTMSAQQAMHSSMNYINPPPPSHAQYMSYQQYPQAYPAQPFYPSHVPPMYPIPPPPGKVVPTAPQFSSAVPPPIPNPPRNLQSNIHSGVPPPPPPQTKRDHHNSQIQQQGSSVNLQRREHEKSISPSSSLQKANEGSIYKRELANLQFQKSGQKRLSSPTNRDLNRKRTTEDGTQVSSGLKYGERNEQEPTTSDPIKGAKFESRITKEMLELYDPNLAQEKSKSLGLNDEESRAEARSLTKQLMVLEAGLCGDYSARICANLMYEQKQHEARIEGAKLKAISKSIDALETETNQMKF